MSKMEEELLHTTDPHSDLAILVVNVNGQFVVGSLGSDRVREVLGFVQIQNGDPHPTLFLEAKAPEQKLLTEGV